VQQNLFDSHDTDRFASMFVNPDLAYDAANRIQDNGPNYKKDKPDAADGPAHAAGGRGADGVRRRADDLYGDEAACGPGRSVQPPADDLARG
jgi:hypothetical protein